MWARIFNLLRIGTAIRSCKAASAVRIGQLTSRPKVNRFELACLQQPCTKSIEPSSGGVTKVKNGFLFVILSLRSSSIRELCQTSQSIPKSTRWRLPWQCWEFFPVSHLLRHPSSPHRLLITSRGGDMTLESGSSDSSTLWMAKLWRRQTTVRAQVSSLGTWQSYPRRTDTEMSRRPIADHDNNQRWHIVYIGNEKLPIVNNGTGKVLTAIQSPAARLSVKLTVDG